MCHCADQPLTLKWACFSSGEQFPTGEAGKRPLSTQPISTRSYPLRVLSKVMDRRLGRRWLRRPWLGQRPSEPRILQAGTLCGGFSGAEGLFSLPSPSLPLQHLPNYRAGLGLACKPSSGFLAAWLFQSHPCRSSSAYTEAASLGGAELGASGWAGCLGGERDIWLGRRG